LPVLKNIKEDSVVRFSLKVATCTKLIFKELSDKILRMAFTIHSYFVPGMLESVYESAFCVELSRDGISFERQKVYALNYKQEYVGAYIANWRKAPPFSLEESAFADSSLVVDNTIILELKAVSKLSKVMEAQIISYLKFSGLPVGYLINFNASSLEWKRFVNKRE
jgi:hypothetical protein